MTSAEVTLQMKTIVGNSSPTALQTLQKLANLYEDADTDLSNWRSVIESHPRILIHFLRSLRCGQLDAWHKDTTIKQLRELTLTVLNQHRNFTTIETPHHHAGANAGRIAAVLAPEAERKARLTARLSGCGFLTEEEDVSEALRYYSRPLKELYDTRLLTRIVAVAHHLCGPEPDHAECSSLTGIAQDELTAITPVQPLADTNVDDSMRLQESVELINLKESVSNLAIAMSPAVAITQLASTFFDAEAVTVFSQTDTGWRNPSYELSSEHSIVAFAASTGRPITTTSHTLTVVDEQIVESLGTSEALALPLLLGESPDSCASVVLLGMSREKLLELSGWTRLLAKFQRIASAGLVPNTEETISLDTLNQAARELIHEANNPLSTVQNYLKVLSLKLGPGHEAISTIESLSDEIQRAATVIERFRTIGRHDHESNTACAVNDILMQQATLFRQSIDVVIDLDSSSPVAGISAQGFGQVISNLIRNAMEAGATRLELVSAGNLRQGTNRYIEIVVANNGRDIDESLNLFERGTSTKEGEDRGQGLAIAQQITTLAGGFISYRSSTGRTEFRITIPENLSR